MVRKTYSRGLPLPGRRSDAVETDGVAAVGGVIVGLVADYLSAQAAVALSTGLGLTLLIPVMLFTPLIKSPVSPAED